MQKYEFPSKKPYRTPNRKMKVEKNGKRPLPLDAILGKRPSVSADRSDGLPAYHTGNGAGHCDDHFQEHAPDGRFVTAHSFSFKVRQFGDSSLMFFGFHPFTVVFTAAIHPGRLLPFRRPAYRYRRHCHRRPHRHFRSSAGTPLPAAGLGSPRWRPDACTPA